MHVFKIKLKINVQISFNLLSMNTVILQLAMYTIQSVGKRGGGTKSQTQSAKPAPKSEHNCSCDVFSHVQCRHNPPATKQDSP